MNINYNKLKLDAVLGVTSPCDCVFNCPFRACCKKYVQVQLQEENEWNSESTDLSVDRHHKNAHSQSPKISITIL